MIRAVRDESVLIAGPNHGTRSVGSSAPKVSISPARALSNQASSSSPGMSRYRAAIFSVSTPPDSSSRASSALNASGSVADRTATSSK